MMQIIHANVPNNITPGVWQAVHILGEIMSLEKPVIIGCATNPSFSHGDTALMLYFEKVFSLSCISQSSVVLSEVQGYWLDHISSTFC